MLKIAFWCAAAWAVVHYWNVVLGALITGLVLAAAWGRLKTDAVADLILGKNPYAKIDRFATDVKDDLAVTEREVAKADVVIVATDNNASRFILNEMLIRQGKVGVYGRANTRAEGGYVFVQRPGGPCYGCLVGTTAYDPTAEEVSSEAAGRRSGHIAAYTAPEDAAAVVQVGLASDIAPIVNMMVKVALVELSRGTASGLAALADELVYDYWMWANRRERRFANWSPLPKAGNLPTILRWYGARIAKSDGCSVCGDAARLDIGASLPQFASDDMSDVAVDLDL